MRKAIVFEAGRDGYGIDQIANGAMTVGELKAQFSEVLEKVKQGETVQILYGRNKKPVAQIVNMEKPKKKRRILGTYAHLGPFTEVGDGKITLEEFFGVKSLDEIEPLP